MKHTRFVIRIKSLNSPFFCKGQYICMSKTSPHTRADITSNLFQAVTFTHLNLARIFKKSIEEGTRSLLRSGGKPRDLVLEIAEVTAEVKSRKGE